MILPPAGADKLFNELLSNPQSVLGRRSEAINDLTLFFALLEQYGNLAHN